LKQIQTRYIYTTTIIMYHAGSHPLVTNYNRTTVNTKEGMSETNSVASTKYCKPNPSVEQTQPSITTHILILSSN
jgi:hypothetical protein